MRHTPPWVFILFAALVAWGTLQTRTRTTPQWRVYILPVVLLVLSCYGVIHAFGLRPAGLSAWLAGVALAVAAGSLPPAPAGARLSQHAGRIVVPGSPLPLVLMLAIFFVKYAVAVTLARAPTEAGDPVLVAGAALAYGLLSGLLFARRRAIRRRARALVVADAPRPGA